MNIQNMQAIIDGAFSFLTNIDSLPLLCTGALLVFCFFNDRRKNLLAYACMLVAVVFVLRAVYKEYQLVITDQITKEAAFKELAKLHHPNGTWKRLAHLLKETFTRDPCVKPLVSATNDAHEFDAFAKSCSKVLGIFWLVVAGEGNFFSQIFRLFLTFLALVMSTLIWKGYSFKFSFFRIYLPQQVDEKGQHVQLKEAVKFMQQRTDIAVQEQQLFHVVHGARLEHLQTRMALVEQQQGNIN